MSNVVSSITTTLAPANLWAVVGEVIPIAGVVTLFALGFWLVKKLFKKMSKAKGGI